MAFRGTTGLMVPPVACCPVVLSFNGRPAGTWALEPEALNPLFFLSAGEAGWPLLCGLTTLSACSGGRTWAPGNTPTEMSNAARN